MAFKNLREFIEMLEKNGHLIRISEPISPVLEMTEIQTRVLAESGPAILFENVINKNGEKFDYPVLVNLFGTVERVAWGMGQEPETLRELGEALAFMRQPTPPGDWKEAINMFPLVKTAMAMKPKTVFNAPCQDIILEGDNINLYNLPIQTCWHNEPSPLITWPLVVTKGNDSVESDNFNLGVYRMQVKSKNTTLMRWLKHRGGAQHHMQQNKNMPVAVVIGADPGTIIAAVAPVPDTMSEYQFAGLLRKKKVELIDCKTVPLKVPAEAEIILEGHVSLDDYENEGPFGDHTGYYNSIEKFPVFTISAITMRKNPIYLSTYTGRPPDEPSILGEALNELFIPLFVQQFPEVVDFWLPPEGCSYRVAVVSIKKAYPGHAKRIMMGVWSFLRQFLYTKFIIVVDEDINVRKWEDVIWAVSTRMDPVRDITMIEHTPIDYLDFASPKPSIGGKIGLDATNKIPPETDREWGVKIEMTEEVIEKISGIWDNLGLPGNGAPIWRK